MGRAERAREVGEGPRRGYRAQVKAAPKGPLRGSVFHDGGQLWKGGSEQAGPFNLNPLTLLISPSVKEAFLCSFLAQQYHSATLLMSV